MDFDLSDDQLALQSVATELLAGLSSPARVRAFTETDDLFDRELWAAMVDQGWLGVGVAGELGGLGMGTVERAVLVEALGRHVAPAPYVDAILAIAACARAGSDDSTQRLLSGESIGCVGWSRHDDVVRAESEGATWYLSGRTDPAPYAPTADIAIVPAATAAGPALFAVDLAAAERPQRQPAMDLTRPLGWLHFDRTPATRFGGVEHVAALLDEGATLVSAALLGECGAVLDMAVEYAKDRVQFGRPIGSFQAVKHRCADMLVDVEAMRSTVFWAAWALSVGDADRSIAASTAKCWASDASKRVMASALQVHGGIGFTWEHDLHFFMKRAQLDQLLFGDASFHRARLTALLRPRVESGASVV